MCFINKNLNSAKRFGKSDFIHKLGIVLKELKETRYWLKVLVRAGLVKSPRMKPLLDECEELCAIAGKSVLTAKHNRSRKRSP